MNEAHLTDERTEYISNPSIKPFRMKRKLNHHPPNKKQERNKEEGINDSYDLFEQQVLFCFA